MTSLFRLGQLLKGKASTYTIVKQLHESIWLATNQSEQTVVIKSARHFRLENERDVLKRFQTRTPSLRPLIDEIEDPPDPPAIVLKHLDDDLLNAPAAQRLTKLEIKCVTKKVLEALKSYMKMVTYIQLITLIWGDNWFIFKPDVPADHEEYELRILMKQHQFFGPFPLSYKEIADDETLAILTYVMRGVPREKMKPFERITEREISKEDKSFVLKIMKLDPRDRPTAKDLLEDVWFKAD